MILSRSARPRPDPRGRGAVKAASGRPCYAIIPFLSCNAAVAEEGILKRSEPRAAGAVQGRCAIASRPRQRAIRSVRTRGASPAQLRIPEPARAQTVRIADKNPDMSNPSQVCPIGIRGQFRPSFFRHAPTCQLTASIGGAAYMARMYAILQIGALTGAKGSKNTGSKILSWFCVALRITTFQRQNLEKNIARAEKDYAQARAAEQKKGRT